MKLEQKIFENKIIGHQQNINNALFFFGNKSADRETISRAYPELSFKKIHQVHGDHLVEVSGADNDTDTPAEADAHWTGAAGVALSIQTADCMPVLISDGQKILAIHSGWRGTLKDIIGYSMTHVFGQSAQSLNILIGPFIQKASFEVGLDVADAFKKLASELVYPHPTSPTQKALVDLASAASIQVKATDIAVDRLEISTIDTKTNIEYASHRRDGPRASRNISFVAKLN